ncbi:hypothetical protein MRU69_08945 [Kocuria flava]|uniref:hypothetical protein n=1 Tax=Kocuria flava TaxID=446860 RepID=UPI001FF3777B|nr:hypothetical protein [Kocuria flava]MCJ8504987.1 hypothetical protein [Kocuria flava]
MPSTSAPQLLGRLSAAARGPLADSRRLAAAGGALYPVLTLLVRLPQTMVPLGVLTTVALVSGSPALGALCAAAVTVGSALCGLAMGAAATWRRRWPGLLLVGVLNPLAVWWLLRVLAAQGAEPAALLPACLLTGLVLPQMGVVCRLRWQSLLAGSDRGDLLEPSQRHESVMDAVGTVLAAGLAGLLAVRLGPAAVLAVAAALTVVSVAVLLLHPSARLPPVLVPWALGRPPAPTHAARQRRRRQSELRLLPVVGAVGLGALVGSVLGAVVVFASSVDAVVSVSWLYAVAGLTSAAAAVLASAPVGAGRLRNRWVVTAAASVLAAMLLSVPDDAAGMVLVLALVGPTVGPVLVAVHGIADQAAQRPRATVLTTVTTSAMSVGIAAGLVLSAWSGEQWGYRTAALWPVLSASVVLAAALRYVHRWQRTATGTGR